MSNISRTRNPLAHNGTSQQERLLAALPPEAFQIDDRSFQDLLNATFQYASLLHYYNPDNQIQGDWTCFWKVDQLTFLAYLSTMDLDGISLGYEQIKDDFTEALATASGADYGTVQHEFHLKLIEYLRLQALRIQETLVYLPEELPFRREIIALIQKDSQTDTEQLAGSLKTLIGFHKEAYKRATGDRLKREAYTPFFGNIWGIPDDAYFDNQINFSDDYRLNDQEDLDKLLKTLLHTFRKIKLRAETYFNKNLETPQSREPHVALFLSFLRLFTHAQDSLNNLTERHLAFYYEQVLCLQKAPAVPDEAFLILELAATANQLMIEQGTAFVGGRDENGRPLIYEPLQDWFINRAQVKDVKTTYLDVNGIFGERDDNGQLLSTPKIYAASDVSLVYQNGIEQPNETAEDYRGMGDNPHLPEGEIGFAIASPQLILREGKRTVDIVVDIENDGSLALPLNRDNLNGKEVFNVKLSSEEEWQVLTYNPNINLEQIQFEEAETLGLMDPSFNFFFEEISTAPPTYKLTIRILLEKDHLAVDQFGNSLQEETGFKSPWPIFHMALKPSEDPDLSSATLFDAFRGYQITEAEIKVKVRDIQENLIIQSDQGVFDGTQKFYPFGPVPELEDHFYIGSTEVFQKALTSLDLKFDWIAPPSNFNTYYDGYPRSSTRGNLLNPAVKIDFIDRADDDNFLLKVLKTGNSFNLKGSIIIEGQIKDVAGDPVVGIKVEYRATPGTGVPDAEVLSLTNGNFIMEITPTAYNNSGGLSFSIPTNIELQNEGLDDIVILPKLELLELEDLEDENDFIEVEDFGNFNITLFPKKVVESISFSDVETVSGQVRDLFSGDGLLNINLDLLGTGLPIVVIQDTDYATASNPNINVLEFDDPSNRYTPIAVDFSQAPFNGNKFPKIDIRMNPTGPRPFGRQFVHTAEFSGNLAWQNAPGQPALSSGQISIIQSSLLTTANVDQLGNYFIEEILLPVPLNSLSFQVDFFGLIQQIPFDPTAVSNQEANYADVNFEIPIDVLGSTPYTAPGTGSTTAVNFRGTIKGLQLLGTTPTDYFFSNLEVNVLVSNTLNQSETVDPTNGTFTIPSITIGSGQSTSLELVFNGVVLYTINNTTDQVFTIEIGPIEHDPTAITFANTRRLQGQVRALRDGLDIALAGVNISVTEQGGNNTTRTFVTDEDGNYDLAFPASVTNPLSWTFVYADYQAIGPSSLSGLILDTQGFSTLTTYMVPQQTYKVLEGTVEDISGAALSSVNIALRDLNDELLIQFPSSDANGRFRINIPIEQVGQSGKVVFSLGDSYERTELPSDLYEEFSEYIIRMHNKLNVVSLINESGNIVQAFNVFINTLNLTRDIRAQEFSRYSPKLIRGFIRLTLIQDDFLHNEYPNALIKSTIEASATTEAQVNFNQNTPAASTVTVSSSSVVIPNKPYTPATNAIRLSYTSTQIITNIPNEAIDEYYHVYPFNGFAWQSLDPITPRTGVSDTEVMPLPLIAQYTLPSFGSSQSQLANGNLYIGIEGLNPGANLSLLIQMQEGSEINPDVEAPKVIWSYLAKDNTWKPLSTQDILADTTKGLGRSGIVSLATPRDMVNETTLFAGGCYWLRIAVSEEVSDTKVASATIGLPSIIDIRAQAVLVQFEDNANDLSHLETNQPAENITQLSISRAALKKIEQPFPTFNGQSQEAGNMFYVRVSERLRHRDRAITIYDYERLILEAFPKIHRTKTLNHTKPGEADILKQSVEPDIELAPGFVTIAVIPALGMRKGSAAAEPRFSKGDLAEMREYLQTKTNLFVACDEPVEHLKVVNPLYEEVQVCLKVQIRQGEDEEARRFDLDMAIKSFLAPWLYDATYDITFGQPLNRSRIILFIEQLSYVDAISDLEIIHCGKKILGNEIVPTTSRSILTTVLNEQKPANETDHKIEPVDDICQPSAPPVSPVVPRFGSN